MPNRASLSFTPGFLILMAIGMICLPLRWIVGWTLAVISHELGHFIVLKLLKKQIYQVSVSARGVVMDTESLSNSEEMLSAFGGPVLGLLMIIPAKIFPELSICAFIQGAYNLLPLYPLDGGRVARGLIMWVFGNRQGVVVFRIFDGALCVLLALAGILVAVNYNYIIGLLIMGIIVTKKWIYLKIPCKRRAQKVQW